MSGRAAKAAKTTLGQALARAAGKPGAGLRFLDRHEAETFLSWAGIHARARETAGRLRALGVEPGERVALLFPTSPDFIIAFFGAVLAGAVPVPLYPPVRLGRLDEYLAQTAGLLRASGAVLALADTGVRRVIGVAIERARPRHGCLRLEDLPPGPPVEVERGPADLAMVQFSSGTLLDPKPVALSHRAVMAQAELLNALWPRGDVEPSGVSWLPLYHDMGLIGCIFTAVSFPGTLTLLPPEAFVVRPALWLRAISRYRAMISVAPNFAFGLAASKVQDAEMEGVDLSSWRVALCGAEAVAPAVLRSFQSRFSAWGFRPEALTPVYGLAEAALAVTFSELDRPFRSRRFAREPLGKGAAVPTEDERGLELASVGRPLPGFSVRIVSDEGDLPEGRVGRILVRGPSLMDGYLGAREATARVLRGGWLDTGDLGFLLGGDLYLAGREKDVLILRGRNHAPETVEQSVRGVSGVRAGCVVAVSTVSHLPEGAATERLLLFVERARDRRDGAGRARGRADAVAEACRRDVLAATGLSLDEVHVLEPGTLPRTTSGKLRRQETLRRHLRAELSPPAPVSAIRLAGAIARSRLAMRRAARAGPADT